MTQSINIIDRLKELDDAYFNAEPLVSDTEYDQLKKKAKKDYHAHPYFMEVGADTRGGKVKLPYTMGSLEQVEEGEISSWIKKLNAYDQDMIESHKLDGASAMIRYNNGELQICYSRGNGVMGADTTRHARGINNIPKSIPYKGHLTIRGEMIMPNDKFDTNWKSQGYANPRNLVAGVMNRKVAGQEYLNDIDFVAYQIVDTDQDNKTDSQLADLELLKSYGFDIVEHRVVKASELSDDHLTSYLKKAKASSKYLLDGVVVNINNRSAQKSVSNSSSLNPDHAFKYKVIDAASRIKATVVDVHYELSQHGFQKPRVEIIPVQLFGTTVTYATGFNGRYIVDNGIGPGAEVEITKAGEVIPFLVQTFKAVEPKLPNEPFEWNKTGIEMVAVNAQNNPQVIFKQVLQFFTTLDVELLKEATLTTILDRYDLRDSSYEHIIETVCSLLEAEWTKTIGVNGSKIYASLQRRLNNMTLETFLGAVKYLGFGFGVRKAKALLRGLNNINDVWSLSINDIENIDGFDTTAVSIVDGLPKAKELLESLDIKLIEEEKTSELTGLVVVFTGFRDKEFQAKLEKSGARVSTSVSTKTTHLLTAEPNSTSGKANKARELGIVTMSLEEFKTLFNL